MSELFEKVRKEGKIEGFNEGRTLGKIEGKFEGIQIGKVEIAKRMFKSNRYAIEDIEYATGMSEKEIKELRNS